MLKKLLVTLAAAVLIFAPLADAQTLYSTASVVNLTMTVGESLQVNCSPSLVTFTYSGSGGGTGSNTTPISCTESWNLAPTRAALTFDAYLGSATQALTDGVTNVASSSVFASFNSGTAIACTMSDGSQPGEAASTGCANWFWAASAGGSPNTYKGTLPDQGTSTDTILLTLSSLGTLPAGVYTGTISICGYAQ